jgi:hypothetical protein
MHFTRNRIRHQIMPQLAEINQDTVLHLSHWAEVARSHYEHIRKTVRLFYSNIVIHRSANQLAIQKRMLIRAKEEILQELLRMAWRKQHWPLDQMNNKRWCEAIEVCRGTRTAVELPGRIMVRSKDLVIQFIKQ